MISKEEVEGLAALARLDLSEGEVAGLQKDISNILEYVGQVSAVSLGAKAIEAPLVRNVLRADLPREGRDTLAGKEEMLTEAFPKREPARPDGSGRSGGGSYNVVRKIIQKDE